MNRQACGDRPMDRCRDAELQASPNDDPAQGLDLETTPVFEVAGHRRSPLWGQRRGLRDGAVHGIFQMSRFTAIGARLLDDCVDALRAAIGTPQPAPTGSVGAG